MAKKGLLEAYTIMLTSRRLDEFFNDIEKKGIRVFNFHSGTGQEALSIGGAIDLRVDDYLIYTHRGYGALMAKGISLRELMLDIFLKVGGTNDGVGSVMHSCCPEKGIIGREGVFGTKFTIAAGLALSIKNRKRDNVSVCYFGEAAGARGPFFEAMNMSVLWNLPVIFVGENNGFTVSSRTKDVYATGNMSDIWRGFRIPIKQFDGNDLHVVRSHMAEAIERARSGLGPSVLEGFTYRIDEHIPGEDHMAYRTMQEIEEWRKKDPVKAMREELLKKEIVTEIEDNLLDQRIQKEIVEAYEEAERAPEPSKEEMYNMVYL